MYRKFQLSLLSVVVWATSLLDAYEHRHEPWYFDRRSPSSMENYDLRMGPVMFGLTGSVLVEYDSNINFSSRAKVSDIIVEPALRVRGVWEFSPVNALSLNLGVSYQKYLENSQLDSFKTTLDTDSELSLTVVIDTLTLQLYERPSYLTDSADASRIDDNGNLISGVGQYRRFENQFGLRGFYDLNIASIDFNVMRADEIPSDSEFSFRDRTETVAQARVRRDFSNYWNAGIGASYSRVRYREDLLNSGGSRSFGPFAGWSPSEYLDISAGVTWVESDFDGDGRVGDTSELSGINHFVEVRHLLNRFYNHRLSLSRRLNYGFLSNTSDIERVAYSFSYEMTSQLNLVGSVIHERSRDSEGPFADNFRRMIYSLRSGWVLGPDLSLTAHVSYSDKRARDLDRSYDKFRAGVTLRYDF